MQFKIVPSSGVPIYLQIAGQIKSSVALGRLHPEDPLPSVRQLALDLTINPNTVARAYLELEHEGFLYKRQGQGTYVCARALGAARRERNRIVSGLLEKGIEEALHSGMSASEIQAVFDRLMDRLVSKHEVETV